MYLMGIDVGTTGVKTVLIFHDGTMAAESGRSYPISSPQNGWFEQNPEDWWKATLLSIGAMMEAAGAKASDIDAIGLSGQYHGLVLLDKAGCVLRPCILWNDQRTAAQSKRIVEKAGPERLARICATRGAPYFTACKLEWVREHEPEIRRRVATVLLPKDYIRFRLTGERCTDVTDASGTLFLDVGRRTWSAEMARLLDADERILPNVVESSSLSGRVSKEAAEAAGLRPGIPVAGGAGDQASAAVGIGVVKEGTLSLSVGTSGVIYAATTSLQTDSEGRFDTFCHSVPGTWCVLACINSAAGSYQWYQDKFAGQEKEEAQRQDSTLHAILEKQAGEIPAGSGRLLFLPYLAGERHPHTDTDARGVFFGLHAGHGKANLLRAILEGVAFSFRDCLEAIRQHDITVGEIRATGGGAQSRLWTAILAAVLGRPITVMDANAGGASFGAAILGGVCAGVYGSVPEACATLVGAGTSVEPDREAALAYERYFQVFRSLYPVLKEPYRQLAQLP